MSEPKVSNTEHQSNDEGCVIKVARKKREKREKPVLLDKIGKKDLQAGVDEVARGCLFGPVYAAAVILNPNEPLHEWLNDSKKVTKKRRAVVRQWIEKTAVAWAVASVQNDVIDEINIRNAAMKAMNVAIDNLTTRPNFLLIDGDYFEAQESISDIPFVTIVQGDAKYANIAAASILAKEHHDQFIREMISKDPDLHIQYDVGNNVGYGTKRHIEGLKTHGASIHHRKSFLKRILPKTNTALKLLFEDSDEEDDEVENDEANEETVYDEAVQNDVSMEASHVEHI